jgi:hypothetical protein
MLQAGVIVSDFATPEFMVRRHCSLATIDLETVHGIARTFTVTAMMAAMRLVELSDQAAAVVYCQRGRVVWMKRNSWFPLRLARNLPAGTGSFALEQERGATMIKHHRRGPLSWWFRDAPELLRDAEMVEHAIPVPEPGWGGVLSLLWLPTLDGVVAAQSSRQVAIVAGASGNVGVFSRFFHHVSRAAVTP